VRAAKSHIQNIHFSRVLTKRGYTVNQLALIPHRPISNMKYGLCYLALILGLATPSLAAPDPLQPRKGEVPASGLYVPVSVDGYASHSAGVEFAGNRVTVGNVPFDLVMKPGADNLFLKAAEWPDWQKDPSSYYAPYDKGPDTPGDPRRPMFKVPVADYSAVYLLAAADNDRALSDVVSFRIGAMDGPRRVVLHDFTARVPRFDEKRAPGITAVIPTKAGNVFLIRVPLGLAFAQDFKDEWAFDVEVTKELRLAVRRPDPCRFQIRPLGAPSGVHVFGMTFQRSPVQMEVTSDEAGHVFNEPQLPVFHVNLRRLGARAGKLSLEAVATDYYGNVSTAGVGELEFPRNGKLTRDVSIPVKKRGWHALTIRLMQGRAELLRRETHFALLPKDTRKHRDESPFGTWDFSGGHYTPDDARQVGPLYVKAGLRYGMFGFTAGERKQYGVLCGSEPASADLLAKKLELDPAQPKSILIFHENAISGAHILRTPDVFTGRPPYQLDEKERVKFEAMWKEATAKAQDARARYPDAKLAFGNGNPHLMEEFARRKFPAGLFDSRGNEAGCFMRMPETQPLDFVANNAGLWMDRQILDAYGYKDKPITQCYEICYPNTNPGNLSLRTQASYFIRHAMHSLAWGIPVIRQGSITDMGNSYYYSNWGASGFCFAKPDVRPKPSYVAIATMTQQLDGAKFLRAVPTGSPVVYAVEFKKPDAGFVTVLWTMRGTRQLTLGARGLEDARVTDMMGNDHTVNFAGGKASLEISSEPVFLAGAKPLTSLTPGAAAMEPRPAVEPLPKPGAKKLPPRMAAHPPTPGAFLVSPLDRVADWQVEPGPNTMLEFYNFECPRRKGDFTFETVSEFEGEKNVLKIAPRLPAAGSAYLPMYSVFAHRQGVELPGEPTEIGLMVNGNGGWGRILFELEDAGGQTWTSIGAAMSGEATRWMADWMSGEELAAMKAMSVGDWNTNDPWQRSRINFEGWRYMRFPLPGNYPGEGYHWPYSSQWKHSGDGVVRYPLKFKKLIVELPEKVLHMTNYAAVPRPEIYLKDLLVTFDAPDKAFAAE